MMKKRLIYWIVLLVFVAVDCFAQRVSVADEQTLTVKDTVQSFECGFKASKNNVSVVNPDWQFTTPSDAACWKGITRRDNLIKLCEASKGTIDYQKMQQIIETPLDDGGAMNENTVYQMVVTPETLTLWLRVIGGTDWLRIELSEFLL